VANRDLSKKITVDVKGEILELKNTLNTMVDQLNSFAGEVSRVAREVGSEGKCRSSDAFAKGIVDRFGQALPDVCRPASDYQILFPNESAYRGFLTTVGTPPAGVGTRSANQAACRSARYSVG
jgi:hypothetical protein